MTDQIKKYLAIAGAIVLAIISGLIVYGNYQHTQCLQALGASKALTAEYNAYKKNAEPLISGLNSTINTLTADRDAAIARANAAAHSQAAIQADLDRLKAETAALPPDALAAHLNAFIGVNQSSPTAGGLFSFTRPGAETTLNIFYERDAFKTNYATEKIVSQNYRLALDASMGETSAWSEKYALKDGEYVKALAAWAADTDALTHLRRSVLGRTVKTFIIGAATGAAAVLIYNAVKGK